MYTAITRTHTVAMLGLEGKIIDVETHVAPGLVAFNLVGLPDAGVKESKDRVRAALQTCGYRWVEHRVTVNLSPANIPKNGSGYDLAIAMGLLASTKHIKTTNLNQTVFIAELGLDGTLQPVRGVLPAALAARKNGFTRLLVPASQVNEAQLVSGIEIMGATHLTEVIATFGGKPQPLELEAQPRQLTEVTEIDREEKLDLADVRGQNFACEALVAAAAGGHNLLMVGEPGSGKTMLAQRLPGILPPLSPEAALEVAAIKSIVGRFNGTKISQLPPLETPHHSASMVAMVGGGGGLPQPGAISLAHHGVLFLDEATEFAPKVLDSLRQPLEQGTITISRAKAQVTFPARFQLIIATNPCPCGYALSKQHVCSCSPLAKRRYWTRLSGPLLDRIDMHIPVHAPSVVDLETPGSYTTATALETVCNAREQAGGRWKKELGITCNAQIPANLLRSPEMELSKEVSQQIRQVLSHGTLSMRAVDRSLRVARTLADMRGANQLEAQDLGKAFQYRDGMKHA